MATVPVQQTPSVDLQVGQAPLFSPTNIEPVRDTGVARDIGRLSNAQKQFAEIAFKLQDEQNDVKAGEAYQGYQTEADEKVNAYLTTQGSAAIATIETDKDGETITAYDKLVKDLDEIAGSYRERLDNSDQIDIFNNKFSASKRIAVNQASKHSIKQQRLALKQETLAEITLAENNAIASYESAFIDDGDFNTYVGAGLVQIKRNAELQGQNTDPTAGPLSSQYILAIAQYNQKINEAVVKQFKEDEEHDLAQKFIEKRKPEAEKNIVTPIEKKLLKDWDQYNAKKVSNAVIKNNGDQNSGNYLDQIDKIMTLKSSHYINTGTGASIKDGLHSDKVNTAGQTQADNINTAELIKNESIFFKLDSNKTLIDQHQPTHIFASLHLGVTKADSLYLKAKREYELPEFTSSLTGKRLAQAKKKFEEEFKNNPDNAAKINAAILNKYNEFIIEATENRFSDFYSKTKTIFPNAPQRSDFPNTADGGRKFREAKKEFLNNPENQVQVNPGVANQNLEAMTGTKKEIGRDAARRFKEEKLQKQETFIDQIANDLGVITKDVNYNNNAANTKKIDFVTGLQPVKDLEKNIKETITDSELQKFAIKDLKDKYNKIKDERTNIYNQTLNKAKEVVYTGENGIEDLKSNGIDIDNFSESDQEILRKGQPQESDVDTVVELINNPAQVRDNLEFNAHKLSKAEYLSLKRYAKTLSSESKYVEATGNVTMLQATLERHDMGDIYKQKRKKPQYIRINDAWLKEINARQIAKGNVKLTMGEKQDALNQILLRDLVSVDNRFRDEKDAIYNLVDFDRLEDVYVDVPYNDENVRVFTSQIDPYVVIEISKNLRKYGQPVTQKNIARDWLRVGKPKSTDELFLPSRSN